MSNQDHLQETQVNPPVVQKKDHKIELHGMEWNDPYFWLRDKENEEVINYLKAENTYTEQVMKHTEDLQERIFEEFKARINETDQSVPTKEGDYYYYSRTVEGENYPIYCRKFQSMEAEEEILLDVNELAKDKDYCNVRSLSVSADHKILAYAVDFNGYEIYTIYLKDLSTQEYFDYNIENSGGQVIWGNKNKVRSLYYNTVDDIKRSYRIHYHQLYQPDNDQIVYEEKNNEFSVYAYKSTDEKLLFIDSHGRESDTIRYVMMDNDPTHVFQFNEQEDQIEYNIDHREGYLYFTTSKDAINFRFCRTEVGKHDVSNWFELVSHRENIRLTYVKMFKDFGVLGYRQEGLVGMRVFDIKTFEDHSIEMPEEIYSVFRGSNPNYDTDHFRFVFSSPITPLTTYDYHIESGDLIERKQEEIHEFNPEEYITERKYAIASDGTKIPLSIAYKKDIEKPAPMLLYGYGSYGHSIDPYFNSRRVSLLKRGIIFVIAHIRGGGEMGKQWQHDGKLMKKKNTFTDFIDSAKYLIENGYTNTEKLAIQGGSAGGLLMGACVNMAPDLFKSVVAQVPFVDVINTMMDDSIPLTTFEYLEWGNPVESKDAFDYMMSYSPYDQVGKNSTEYPNMLIMGGLNDPRVHFWEPTKWTAKLRDIKTDDNILLLKTNMGAGHGGSSGRYDYMKEEAFIYAFLIDTLELDLE